MNVFDDKNTKKLKSAVTAYLQRMNVPVGDTKSLSFIAEEQEDKSIHFKLFLDPKPSVERMHFIAGGMVGLFLGRQTPEQQHEHGRKTPLEPTAIGEGAFDLTFVSKEELRDFINALTTQERLKVALPGEKDFVLGESKLDSGFVLG